jgi:hypothetical protein
VRVDPRDNRTVHGSSVSVLVAFLLVVSVPAAQAQGEPAFSYAAYCDAQGHFTYDGAAQTLVQRPAHLRRVYEDAAHGNAQAKEVVRELEQVFQGFGSWLAEETTRPECLGLPELTPGCLPRLGFLDELLGSTPEAARLRDVVAEAYEARARTRSGERGHPLGDRSAPGARARSGRPRQSRSCAATASRGSGPDRGGQRREAGAPINWGQQEKHFPGHNSYQPGRSTVTANPEKLVEKAGTGQQAGGIPVGRPGSKERVDFGETIGTHIDPSGKASSTTKGIIHYGKDGVHIVPAKPTP